jgi:hypothetical protein
MSEDFYILKLIHQFFNMKRRRFVRNGLMACSAPLVPLVFNDGWKYNDWKTYNVGKAIDKEKPSWLVHLIRLNDERVENQRKRRITNKADPDYGGVLDGYDMVSAHAVTSFLRSGICALVSRESDLFHNKELREELVQQQITF